MRSPRSRIRYTPETPIRKRRRRRLRRIELRTFPPYWWMARHVKRNDRRQRRAERSLNRRRHRRRRWRFLKAPVAKGSHSYRRLYARQQLIALRYIRDSAKPSFLLCRRVKTTNKRITAFRFTPRKRR
jgi:hypothetical protein